MGTGIRKVAAFGAFGLAVNLAVSAVCAHETYINDYPTVARADYVFACMAANGQTRDILEKCACSIDVIATILPYDTYVEAEAVLQIVQVGGEKTSIFRSSKPTQDLVATLRRAQVEGELRCF